MDFRRKLMQNPREASFMGFFADFSAIDGEDMAGDSIGITAIN